MMFVASAGIAKKQRRRVMFATVLATDENAHAWWTVGEL